MAPDEITTHEKQLMDACGELLQQLIDEGISPDGYEFFAAYDIKKNIGLELDTHMMFDRPFTFMPGMKDGDVFLMKKGDMQWTKFK